MVKSNQENQDSSGNQKNVIQGHGKQTCTTKDINKQYNTYKVTKVSNTDSTKNWEHGPGALVG